MTTHRTDISDPKHPDYYPEARDAIMNLAPFYDPHHKCGIVREDIFKSCLWELRERERVAKKSYFDGSNNLAYIIIFLRNGGERLRAIWLAKNTLNLSNREAADWVDSVELISEPREHEPRKVASHWPESVTQRIKEVEP
jgi:hypothetical protein